MLICDFNSIIFTYQCTSFATELGSLFASFFVIPNSVLKFKRTSHFEVLRELLTLTKITSSKSSSKKILITFSLKGQQSVFITLSNVPKPFWLFIYGFKTSRTTIANFFWRKVVKPDFDVLTICRKWSFQWSEYLGFGGIMKFDVLWKTQYL